MFKTFKLETLLKAAPLPLPRLVLVPASHGRARSPGECAREAGGCTRGAREPFVPFVTNRRRSGLSAHGDTRGQLFSQRRGSELLNFESPLSPGKSESEEEKNATELRQFKMILSRFDILKEQAKKSILRYVMNIFYFS